MLWFYSLLQKIRWYHILALIAILFFFGPTIYSEIIQPKYAVEEGGQGYLSYHGFFAISLELREELQKYRDAHNLDAMEVMGSRGQATVIPGGSKVTVISHHGKYSKIMDMKTGIVGYELTENIVATWEDVVMKENDLIKEVNKQPHRGLTLAKFNEIKDGMSYADVVRIIGEEGVVTSESGSEGAADHTVIYQYDGAGQIGANASFMFQGGKLINKSQFGLE